MILKYIGVPVQVLESNPGASNYFIEIYGDYNHSYYLYRELKESELKLFKKDDVVMIQDKPYLSDPYP